MKDDVLEALLHLELTLLVDVLEALLHLEVTLLVDVLEAMLCYTWRLMTWRVCYTWR